MADRAGAQFRLLNGSKAPAVRGPRAQFDGQLCWPLVQGAVLSPRDMAKASRIEDMTPVALVQLLLVSKEG